MTSPGRLPARATYDDVRRVADGKVAEIIDGELIVSPRPAVRHARAATVLNSDLGGPFDRPPGGGGGPGGWWLLFEPELHLAEDILVPDLAGWRRERLHDVSDAPFLTVAPDWICEVVSPSTRGTDRVRKLPIYARERVGHVWLLDPIDRVLEVFRLEGKSWLLAAAYQGPVMVRAPPFEALELDLGRLWLDDGAAL